MLPSSLRDVEAAGIPVEDVPISHMLRQEPLLNPGITHCFYVPDGSADSFLATESNIASAREYGAHTFTYFPVTRLLTSGETPSGTSGFRVTGALCYDRVSDEEVVIHADMVVNASGAWAGQIAGSVGIKVHIIPGKGTMLAMNHRIINTVINRCKLPSDGDILVPIHTVTVIGTTDVKVIDPDHYPIEPWEVNLCLEEGDKLVPGFKEMRMLRAWAGVRPLYQESDVTDTRDVTRAFVLLDHESRDGVAGLITITSGKWTTYRKMAEVTADLVCSKLGVQHACRTDKEILPDPGGHSTHRPGFHSMGSRLARVESDNIYGELICECELATRKEVETAILSGQTWTLDDIRRDVRLGMGPCQGGFCTYRAAGLVHQLASEGRPTLATVSSYNENKASSSGISPPSEVPSPDRSVLAAQTNLALRDFLQERWKGLLPVLWGQQLRQERLDELVVQSVLNADHLPGPRSGRLSPDPYASLGEQPSSIPTDNDQSHRQPSAIQSPMQSPAIHIPSATLDVLIVGGGLAGLFSAWLAAKDGKRTRLVTKGWGALYWNAGTVDVLGYYPLDREQPVSSPAAAVRQLIREHPEHPYAKTGIDHVRASLEALQDLCRQADYPLRGSLERNWLLPTALGAARPACLAPETMVAGDLHQPGEMLLVGFQRYLDFYPHLAADNLSSQGYSAKAIMLDLPSLAKHRMVNARLIAKSWASSGFIEELVTALRPHLGDAARIGFPALLGFENAVQVQQNLQSALGLPVFEIPTLPPSIPGIRLHRLLLRAVEGAGGRVYEGMQAVGFEADENQVIQVFTEAAARRKPHRAHRYILATGGILGGGLLTDYRSVSRETVFDLPLPALPEGTHRLDEEFLAPGGHPIYRLGVSCDSMMRPVDSTGKMVYTNLHTVGAILNGGELIRERSLEGVALATSFHAYEAIKAID